MPAVNRETINWMKRASCDGAAGLAVFKSWNYGELRYLYIMTSGAGFQEELDWLKANEYEDSFGLLEVYDLYLAKNRNLFIKEVEDGEKTQKLV